MASAPEVERRIRGFGGDYGGIGDDPATGAIWMFHMYASEPSPWYDTWVGELQLGAAGTTTTSTTATTIRGCGS